MCSCNDEEQFEPLESQKIISEITLKVSDPLPLLINTDSLVAYEVLPEDANNKNVIWTSSNEEIASVDAEDESMPTISERHLLLWLQKQVSPV